jgi:hypothetical protein
MLRCIDLKSGTERRRSRSDVDGTLHEDMEEAGVWVVGNNTPAYDFGLGELGDNMNKMQIKYDHVGKKRRIGEADVSQVLALFSAVDMMSDKTKSKPPPTHWDLALTEKRSKLGIFTGLPGCDRQGIMKCDGHDVSDSATDSATESEDELTMVETESKFSRGGRNSSQSFARRSPSPIRRAPAKGRMEEIILYDDPLR